MSALCFCLYLFPTGWGFYPVLGSIGIYQLHAGHVELILLLSANADLNMTIAMAVFAVITSHLIGIVAIGFKYANKFIKLGDLYHAVKSLSPIKILTAVIEFLLG